ncbi:Gfo/Idh/MocA family protein [Shinella pollutisoli]|uniref:Gfo/Idh/MocA family protein n=1 Tax=Shinella pollutisoli TaxID=2250594 RepID=A0ABV7DGD7_9HYPH|nr:Gfo/Idh/MocA family oxidoreductase [Shinella pollutisoli]
MTFPQTLPAARIAPAMEAPPLRWGILGSGWIAGKFTQSVKAHTRQEIAAVGSRTQAAADAFATRFGIARAHGSYEALVTDAGIDVIYVATPHNLHHAHVLLAIEAGKHVLVEKPMALNRAQAMEMVAAARRKGVFLAEALWTYFLPKFDVLQQVLDAGTIGEIRSVYTEYGEYLPRGHRIFDARLAGGPLLDLGTYPVSFLTKLLDVPERVVGLGTDDPAGVNGQLSVVLANAKGALGTMSTTLYGFTPTNAAIVGTKGSIRFTSEFHLPGGFEVRSLDGSVVLRYEEPRGAHFEGLYYEAADVARTISAGGLESACRPLDATLDTMAVLDAIRGGLGIRFTEAGLDE